VEYVIGWFAGNAYVSVLVSMRKKQARTRARQVAGARLREPERGRSGTGTRVSAGKGV
jgi:hypothetical protein